MLKLAKYVEKIGFYDKPPYSNMKRNLQKMRDLFPNVQWGNFAKNDYQSFWDNYINLIEDNVDGYMY